MKRTSRKRGRGERRGRLKLMWLLTGIGIVLGLAVIAATQFSVSRRASTMEHPDLPGIDVAGLSAEQFQSLLAESKATPCPCGCGFKLAECRVKDPTCPTSGPMLATMVEKYRTPPHEVE